jgi:DNA-binding transcriptional MocR family regulator
VEALNLSLQVLTRPGDIALEQGFSVAPGPIFSARRAFRHCLRLNYGHPWTSASDGAVRALGRILRD